MDGEDDGRLPLLGDIYRNCVAFFSGINDNMISLESFEYAENRLRIAEATAKETCLKFMQETLPELFFDPPSQMGISPYLEENGYCYEAPVTGDQDHGNGQITSNSSFTDQGDSTRDKQTEDDRVGAKDINTEPPNVAEKNDILSSTTDLESSTSAQANQEKCDCEACYCHEMKKQRQMSEEPEWEFEDCYESDWEII